MAFDAPQREPLLRCPHCRAIGFPDRAGLYLIDLAWDCEACGEHNDGQHNFCVYCGTGLTSRCLRCEQPVTGALCIHCGTHQARAGAQRAVNQRRAEWVPILRRQASAPVAEAMPVVDWQPVLRAQAGDDAIAPQPLPGTLQAAAPAPLAQRQQRRRAYRRLAALAGSGGLLALSLQLTQGAYAAPWVAATKASISTIRDEVLSISSTDPRYSMLLAGLVLAISFTPLILFLLASLIRALARSAARLLA